MQDIQISGYKSIAEFVAKNYKDRGKIVEVGMGEHAEVALLLRGKCEIVVTDIKDLKMKNEGLNFFRDDIFKPDLKIYEGASLIYSIRPPVDLQFAIADLAKKIGADLLIRPFASEFADLSEYFKDCELINYKGANFYLYWNNRKPTC